MMLTRLALVALAFPAAAATIQVTDPADVVGADGACGLREAIDNANLPAGGDASGGDCVAGDAGIDTILIPAGTYLLTLTGTGEDANAGGDLDLLDDVILAGEGSDTTIIESGGTDRVLDAGPGGAGVSVEIRGLQLKGGSVAGDGGGLLVGSGSTVEVTESWFAGNTAERGGGIYSDGTLTVADSDFFGNRAIDGGDGGAAYNASNADFLRVLLSSDSAEGRGGGIFNIGTVIVDDSHFSFGQAIDGGGLFNAGNAQLRSSTFGVCHVTGNGGAFHHAGLAMVVDDVWALNNSAEGHGGTVYTTATMFLRNSILQGGVAFLEGGGIYHALGNLIVSDTRVEHNQSGERGGGISNHSNFQAQRVRVYNNYTQFAGGGMYNAGVAFLIDSQVEFGFSNVEGGGIYNANFVSLERSLLAGSAAQTAGGLYAGPGTISNMRNTTVSGNNAWIGAGGLHVEGEVKIDFTTISDNRAEGGGTAGGLLSLGDARLKNSIIAGNTVDCVQSGTVTSFGYNVDGDGTCGLTGVGDLSGVDPNLSTLQDFGGSSRTHAIFAPSVAIDSADPACMDQLGQIPATDQRGMTRPMDGDGDTLAVCDRGAFEAAVASGPLPEIQNLIVGKADALGTQLDLEWDPAVCSVGYHLLFGDLSTVSSHSVFGAECDLTAGTHVWTPLSYGPSDLWFLITADDGSHTEGSWGSGTAGIRRPGAPSGQCSMSARDDSDLCP